MRIFDLDLVDHVDAEVQMDALVAQDVLILLGDADHLVAPSKREDLRKAGVEPHALENDVECDQIAQERLIGLRRAGGERRIAEALGMLQRPQPPCQ